MLAKKADQHKRLSKEIKPSTAQNEFDIKRGAIKLGIVMQRISTRKPSTDEQF